MQELAAVDDVQNADGDAEEQRQDPERQGLRPGARHAAIGLFHGLTSFIREPRPKPGRGVLRIEKKIAFLPARCYYGFATQTK